VSEITETDSPVSVPAERNWVHLFRQSSPYINAHRGKTMVLALSGEAFEHDNFVNILHDIALLNSLGVRLVLVYGARPQIDRCLAQANITSGFHYNLRITQEEAMPYVLQAVGGLRGFLEARLSTGIVNSPMYGAGIRVVGGNVVLARPVGVLGGVDLCYTGKVRRVDTDMLQGLLAGGSIVLVSSVGYSLTGEAFNLSYEDVAASVAVALKAEKLVMFSDQLGVVSTEDGLIREVSVVQSDQLLAQDVLADECRNLLSLAASACKQGVIRSHIISYVRDGALLEELFTRDGIGTLVTDDNYEQIRSACIEDIGGILELLHPLEELGILVRRSRELLETEIENFTVDERDGSIIGCAALYVYAEEKVGELACFAVTQSYRRSGRGDMLLTAIEKKAKARGMRQLFVLTTQTEHWFRERGFEPASTDDLPQGKKITYNQQRKSKVFVKKLS
jgi:amino-acid N-acetyltransferase